MPSTAQRLLDLGIDWYRRGELDEARALLEASRDCAEVLGELAVAAEAWTHLGRAAYLASEPMIAAHAFERSAEGFQRAGARDRAMLARVRQSFVAYDAGERERARRILEPVVADASCGAEIRGLATGYLGNLARGEGDLDAAREHYERAIALLDEADDALYAATFRMDLAIVALLDGDAGAAHAHLEAARRRAVDAPEDPMLTATLSHYRILALAAVGEWERCHDAIARHAAPESDTMDALRASHALLSEIPDSTDASRASLRDRLGELRSRLPAFEHARLTLRILRGLAGGSTESDDRLTLIEAERTARLSDGVVVTFPEGSAEWRLLLALVAHRDDDASPCLSPDALIEAGWPGERIAPKAAKNRLHVALSGLRRRGFRDVLLRHPGGYALSRALVVVRVAQSETE